MGVIERPRTGGSCDRDRGLRQGRLFATKKACPTQEASEQEAGYLAALESAVRIEHAGPQLMLLNAKGQKAVTLTRRR